MGVKDSKPSFITFEDAVKRVPDSEHRRIREAFKRCAGANGTSLSLEAFVHEVLCDGVPYEVAEWLYQACGGTKRGIPFKELLCGIVVLTKGNLEEKIKFLWTLYVNNQNDNGTYIYKRDFARALHLENTSLPVTEVQRSAEILTSLFGLSEKVTFEQFRSWLLIHKDATVLSKWLLADIANPVQELETPTFYQSLAGVTHLEERDIIELEKCFWSLRNSSPSGQLDAETLTPLLSPPLPRAAAAGAVLAFDENRDGHVDFKELCCGLSAACRGPRAERLKFCFRMFDADGDGVLSRSELDTMLEVLCSVANEAIRNSSRASTPSAAEGGDSAEISEGTETEKGFEPSAVLAQLRGRLVAHPRRRALFRLGEADEGVEEDPPGEESALSLEDFLIWSVEGAAGLVTPLLDLVFEACHVVLGLRPQCRHQERDIVLGWMRRAVCRGYAVGQFWYLVGSEWWAGWLAYCAAGAPCCRHARIDDPLVCDESITSNSTESMGSLLWRAETGSVGSAGSSGVSSAASRAPRHPGPVDNKRLLAANHLKVRTLTGEGGHLRRDATLAQHRDFELLPDALWRAIAAWYGGPDPLPRQVIRPPNSDLELELYPLQLKVLRHVATQNRLGALGTSAMSGGLAGAAYSSVPAPAPPDRQLAYTAAFSRLATVKQVSEFLCSALGLNRDVVRLWAVGGTNGQGFLLDDERPTLAALGLDSTPCLLLEVRNHDLTWPEEIGALSAGGSRLAARRETLAAPDVPGATGLHNLGNTCYMNAALQAVWNTGPLTAYFNSGTHLYEVNAANPLGTRGALALRFGELCKEVWSGRSRSVAPLRVRCAVSRHARALAGGGQHDAQELLAWLLDALHEDLNRARLQRPPPPALPDRDSNGRPDQEVAAEAWASHLSRNQSIMTELFYGQLKSKVVCGACGQESVRFDAFNMLSLPLPMESYVRYEVKVVLLDGSVPVKYGVRVSPDASPADIKQRLHQLCGLPPERMLLVEVSGAMLGRSLGLGARLPAQQDLHAYETPASAEHHHDWWCSESAGLAGSPRGEVSVGAGGAARPSALCMPALFCFKRREGAAEGAPERAEGAGAGAEARHDWRSNTLPKDLSELRRISYGGSSSPALSVKSLTLQPRPGAASAAQAAPRYLVAVHRKQCRMDAYFLWWQRSRPALFGVPLVVAAPRGATGRALYAAVWRQVARLLSASPPPPQPGDHRNHAADCDDSLGYSFPFCLRLVSGSRGALWCAVCAWPALCRGCALPVDDTPLLLGGDDVRRDSTAQDLGDSDRSSQRLPESIGYGSGTLSGVDLAALQAARVRPMLAVDWDPTALHLRYQSTREKAFTEHQSVAECAAAASRPVDLSSCLRAFTRSEQLDERYHCAACKARQPATKKLQIWRAPPILIIHLKRFQYVNNKWIKSQKVVNFPFSDFDPTPFLAAVPQETILRHQELIGARPRASLHEDAISESEDEATESDDERVKKKKEKPDQSTRKRRESGEPRTRRARLESTSLSATPVLDDALVDYHQHRLLPDQDPFDLKYRLYAVVSHSGQLSGGHYVSYARNPSGAWLCYNDSSCREQAPADPAAAYLLFYERQGLRYESYLPDTTGKQPVKDADALDPDDIDLKKCVIA